LRTTRNLTAAVAVAIAAGAMTASASARSVTETATAPLAAGGSVTAALSYIAATQYGVPDDSGIRLTITRAGQSVFTGPVSECPEDCVVSQGDGAKAIHVVDLQANGEPDVFVDLYSGGAHCCGEEEFYTYHAATQRYSSLKWTWGDPGYRLEKLAGKYVFLTDDDAFAYEFTDYAASGFPIKLLSFTGSALVNVTRQHPSLIETNAAENLKAYKQQAPAYSDSVGVIAAWAADEDELGHSVLVATFLRAQAAAGHLNSALSPEEPSGTRFITKLNAFLRKEGYLS
jgi:hypothetical protein